MEDDRLPSRPAGGRFHVHMTLAHFPCALFPFSLLLYIAGAAGVGEGLGSCSVACLVGAVAAVPLAQLAGFWSWRRHRTASDSGIFTGKAVASGLLLLAGLVTLVPELGRQEPRPAYGVGLVLCLWLTAIVAHLGGKIVFGGIGLRPEDPTTPEEPASARPGSPSPSPPSRRPGRPQC